MAARTVAAGCPGYLRVATGSRIRRPCCWRRRWRLRLRTWRPFDTPPVCAACAAHLHTVEGLTHPPHRHPSAGPDASVSTRRLRAVALRWSWGPYRL